MVKDVMGRLGATAHLILDRLADGKGYDEILVEFPHLTFFDIANSASSVVEMTDDAREDIEDIRRVFLLISEGYGLTAIAEKLGMNLFRIQQTAWRALELDRMPTRRKRTRNRTGRRRIDSKRAVPSRVGESWTAEEESRMVALYEHGTSIASIASELGRTRKAISSRLKKVGRISQMGAAE